METARDRHLVSLLWVALAVRLLPVVCGALTACAVGVWAMPQAYEWRGYAAMGGEWLLVMAVFAAGYWLAGRMLLGLRRDIARACRAALAQKKSASVGADTDKPVNGLQKNPSTVYHMQNRMSRHKIGGGQNG